MDKKSEWKVGDKVLIPGEIIGETKNGLTPVATSKGRRAADEITDLLLPAPDPAAPTGEEVLRAAEELRDECPANFWGKEEAREAGYPCPEPCNPCEDKLRIDCKRRRILEYARQLRAEREGE